MQLSHLRLSLYSQQIVSQKYFYWRASIYFISIKFYVFLPFLKSMPFVAPFAIKVSFKVEFNLYADRVCDDY